MFFTCQLFVIIAAVLIGAYLFQMGEKNDGMSDEEKKNADMYRNYSYLLFGVAVVVAMYYYYVQNNNNQKASMCGNRSHMYHPNAEEF